MTRVGHLAQLLLLLLVLFPVVPAHGANTVPNGDLIIRRSMAANEADWAAAPDYSYSERTRDDDGVKTFDVTMMLGSPYKRLLLVNDKPLTAADRRNQERRLAEELARRHSESPSDRDRRVAEYQQSREHAHRILEEMPRAFEYRVLSTRRVGERTVYVLQATPRAGYAPPTVETRVLTSMRGEFWIDTSTFQWVKGTARVMQPVSIAGFLARVQPGTELEVELASVAQGVWLPKHFELRSRSSILFLFHHHKYEDDTYFNYRKLSGF